MYSRGVDRQSASQGAAAKVARPEISCKLCVYPDIVITSTTKVIFTVAVAYWRDSQEAIRHYLRCAPRKKMHSHLRLLSRHTLLARWRLTCDVHDRFWRHIICNLRPHPAHSCDEIRIQSVENDSSCASGKINTLKKLKAWRKYKNFLYDVNIKNRFRRIVIYEVIVIDKSNITQNYYNIK